LILLAAKIIIYLTMFCFHVNYRASFKTSPFAQYLRQAQILILEILHVFLWLKFSPSLILNKIEHFETASKDSIK